MSSLRIISQYDNPNLDLIHMHCAIERPLYIREVQSDSARSRSDQSKLLVYGYVRNVEKTLLLRPISERVEKLCLDYLGDLQTMYLERDIGEEALDILGTNHAKRLLYILRRNFYEKKLCDKFNIYATQKGSTVTIKCNLDDDQQKKQYEKASEMGLTGTPRRILSRNPSHNQYGQLKITFDAFRTDDTNIGGLLEDPVND